MTQALLIELAVKSTVVAGTALTLLALLRRRSAAERSWVAHAALVVLAALPAAVALLPRWRPLPPVESAPISPAMIVESLSSKAIDPAPWLQAIYAGGAILLFLATLVAVLRLIALRQGAAVLSDPHWRTALARAEARMKVRAGAALLVSPAVASPVSWGLIKPTIVVNQGLVASKDDADAVIAHELAHVVRRDWAKLIGARLVTALFWFNPLVWALASQCHQLREEAADDAVLGAEVSSADYASLLIEAARCESRGGLIAAHGVAPGRGSLHRRVTRVLDAAARRTPTPAAWAIGVTAGALLFAGPLAALTLERDKAAPVTEGVITGTRAAAAEPPVASHSAPVTAPMTVTVTGARRAKTARPRAAAATEGATQAKAAAPAVTTTAGLALRKGKLTLAHASASPGVMIDKPGAPEATIALTASPRAPKVAIAAGAGAEATTILGKSGDKIVLEDGLTMVRNDLLRPRTAVTVTGKASASSSSSHTLTTNGKTLRIERDSRGADAADRRNDEAERRRDEAERLRDKHEAERDAQRDAQRQREKGSAREAKAAADQRDAAEVKARAAERQAAAAATLALRKAAAVRP